MNQLELKLRLSNRKETHISTCEWKSFKISSLLLCRRLLNSLTRKHINTHEHCKAPIQDPIEETTTLHEDSDKEPKFQSLFDMFQLMYLR